uniref:Uncharacterized protein n=1 Tax=Arundo donax TaxID=35708 RepID=A0A0A9FPY4_ARUDO
MIFASFSLLDNSISKSEHLFIKKS